MVFVIARRYTHFRNWMREQKLTPRHVIPIIQRHDINKILGYQPSGFVKLTPMEDPRDEERLMEIMKAKQFYPLSSDCNDWPLTEFPFEARR